MPDISMCSDDQCPSRVRCYRHKASGTNPSEGRQFYMDWQRPPDEDRCHGFEPVSPPQPVKEKSHE